ncbi:hypothetical protein OIO90_005128 [Microbotryomycetes sp. JL221]|nr:hypothetical protein OIO90_005128 [Microbotryomycetes sp. JL221]
MPPHHRAFTNSVEERRRAAALSGVVTRSQAIKAQAQATCIDERGAQPNEQHDGDNDEVISDHESEPSRAPLEAQHSAMTRVKTRHTSSRADLGRTRSMDERMRPPRRSTRLSSSSTSSTSSSPIEQSSSSTSTIAPVRSSLAADQRPAQAASAAALSDFSTSEPRQAAQRGSQRSLDATQSQSSVLDESLLPSVAHSQLHGRASLSSETNGATINDATTPATFEAQHMPDARHAEQNPLHQHQHGMSRSRPPQLIRRTSMPTSSGAVRQRASSFSPERQRLQRSVPSNGRVDSDTHWLSEDEGRTSFNTASTSARPRGSMASGSHHGTRTPPNEDEQDPFGHGLGRKSRPDVATFESTTHKMHSIHHRPSTALHSNKMPSRPSSPDSPASQLVPLLVPLATCRSCDRLMFDPTTLACGHSVCLACSVPVVHRASDLPHVASALPQAIGIAHTESQFARNPTLPISASSVMSRSSSAGSRVSELLQRTRSNSSEPSPPWITAASPASHGSHHSQRPASIASADQIKTRPISVGTKAKCPYKGCLGAKERPGAGGSALEPRVDFTLQKLLQALRLNVPGIDTELDRVKEELELDSLAGDDEWDEHQDAVEPFMSRSASGSSGDGGQDSPINDEDQKRLHKTKTNWSPVKRMRRVPSSTNNPIVSRMVIDYDSIPSSFQSDLLSEVECQICVQLLHDPVTSACGHTFCQTCLARSYDHSDKCPLCRRDLPSYTFFRTQAVNSTLDNIIKTCWPVMHADRLLAANKELADNEFVPLFVCTLSWPNLPTFIHVFEPRYRLMIRRAMDSNRQFGMVLPGRQPGEINDYGTMLYIRTCNMIEDGRSIVETVGTYRFRILDRSSRDGYTTGRVERIDDISPEQELELERRALESNNEPVSTLAASTGDETSPGRIIERSTAELMSICLEFVQTLRSGSAPWVIQRLNNTIGPMPHSPADFSFWMAEVMPVDDQLKATLLKITSPRERLRLLVFWIEQVRSSWWFSRGCTIM